MWRVIYLVSPRTPEGGQAGKGDKPSSYHILRSRGAHTQLLLATSERAGLLQSFVSYFKLLFLHSNKM
ncbi:phosphinothricin acetyltransferase [Capnocytophaga ochracea]|uniref:phosphinothricin acetyltransferase n=1 Tax=Capnocytophaga ochracea TaxID=1018 RepID=UPI0021636959|nr:phosphinothricin acetyltransferase [Capnocytophaga ochracea]